MGEVIRFGWVATFFAHFRHTLSPFSLSQFPKLAQQSTGHDWGLPNHSFGITEVGRISEIPKDLPFIPFPLVPLPGTMGWKDR
jgi:hypothetical protein